MQVCARAGSFDHRGIDSISFRRIEDESFRVKSSTHGRYLLFRNAVKRTKTKKSETNYEDGKAISNLSARKQSPNIFVRHSHITVVVVCPGWTVRN